MTSVTPVTGDQIVSVDARTGAVRGQLGPASSAADVDRACAAAAGTLPALAEHGPSGRARLLRLIADRLDEAADLLVPVADAETALGEQRLRGEVTRSSHQFRLFAQVLDDGAWLDAVIDHPDPAWPSGPRPDLRRMAVPLGVVAVFAASNFPFAFSVIGGDVASALAAGCPVVVKAHPGHPETSLRCADVVRAAAQAAGYPADVLAVVSGVDAGRRLVLDPRVRAVGFTGSVAGGRALFDLAVSRPDPIPFHGELGSVNPVVVTPRAAAERADEIGEGLVGSFTLGNGQFCTKPGLVFVPAGDLGGAVERAVAAHAAQRPAAPMLVDRMLSDFVAGVATRTGISGVRLVAQGRAPRTDRESQPHVLAVDAAALGGADADLLADECFGPVVLLVHYRDADDLLAALSRLPGSLTGSIHAGTDDVDPAGLAGRAVDVLRTRVGRLVWNGWPTGVSVTWAMQHGGPWPSSTQASSTSVGSSAITRWVRPVAFQNFPDALLPAPLREANPLGLPRRVDGVVRTMAP